MRKNSHLHVANYTPAAGRHSRPDRESHCIAFLKAAQFLSPESHSVVEELIDDLGLVFIRAEKVEETDSSSPT